MCSANYGPNYLSYTRGNCASCYIDCFRDTLFTAGSKKYFPTRTKRDQCMKLAVEKQMTNNRNNQETNTSRQQEAY